jgi:hypothetical protein
MISAGTRNPTAVRTSRLLYRSRTDRRVGSRELPTAGAVVDTMVIDR